MAHQVHQRALTLAPVSRPSPRPPTHPSLAPPSSLRDTCTSPKKKKKKTRRPANEPTRLALAQIPLGHRGAPVGRLRDRAGPERAADRAAPTLRPLLAPLLGPMPVLRPDRTLARVVRRRDRWHAGALGRARSGDGIGSPRTCFHSLFPFDPVYLPLWPGIHKGGGGTPSHFSRAELSDGRRARLSLCFGPSVGDI